MSIDATRWAWAAPVNNSSQRLVLLSLADRAGEEHTAWPSIERLAKDTVLDKKTVQKVILELIKLGLVEDTGERKGPTKRVRVLKLNGVKGREECTQNRDDSNDKKAIKSNPNTPENGNIKQPQKRNSTKIGIDPKNGIGNEPKIGVCNEPKIGLGNLPIEPNNESNNIKEKFSFAGELKKLGANEQLISDWLQVRKAKKAGNTETALNGFMKQVEKSGLPLDTVLEICVIRSWQGFNVDWLKNIDLSEFQPKQTTPISQNLKTVKGAW